MITQRGSKWCAVSEAGDVTFGCYATEAEARERLRQVEAAKAAKDDARDQAPRVQVVRALSADSAVVKAARRGDSVKRIDYAGTITFDERNDAATCRGDLQAYRTPEGFIRCRGRINGIGVYEYEDQDGNRWGELRLPEHVFAQEVLDAWKLAPLTDDHPAEGYVTPDNAQRLVVGSIGSDVEAIDEHTVADISINTRDAIAKAERGKIGLSCGYGTTLIESAGIYNGVPYHFVQTNIVPNHVSIVDEARGPGCQFIIDGVRSVTGDSRAMSKKKSDAKIMIGEQEHEVADPVAKLIEELTAKVEEQGAMLAKLQGEGETADEDMPMEPAAESSAAMAMDGLGKRGKKQSADALEARLAFLEAERKRNDEAFGLAVSKRVELVSVAGRVLGRGDSLASMTDAQIKAAVVVKIQPDMKGKLDGKSVDYIDAAYEMAIGTHRERTNDSTAPLRAAIGHATLGGGTPDKLDLNKLAHDSAAAMAPGRRRN